MPSITFDARKWRRGSSSTPFARDGGFSFDTVGIDFISTPGLATVGVNISNTNPGDTLENILPEAGILDITTPQTIVDKDCVLLTYGTQGQLVKITGASTESVIFGPDTTAGHTYAKGVSFVVHYKGNYYWTSNTDIAKDGDFDWGSTIGLSNALTTGLPHPMLVFDDFLIIADGNYLHTWDGSIGEWQALDLPAGYVITALESWNGLIWMHAERINSNLSGIQTGQSSLFTWDAKNPNTFLDEFPINQRVTAMKVHLGNLYAWTSQNFCQFDGKNFTPIFPIFFEILNKDIASSGNNLFFNYPIYQTNRALTPGRIYYDRIACYGSIGVGSPPVITFPIVNDYFNTSTSVSGIVAYGTVGYRGIRHFWRRKPDEDYIDTVSNILFPQGGGSKNAAINAGYETCEIFEDYIAIGAPIKITRVTVILSDTQTARTLFQVGYRDANGTIVELMDVGTSSAFGNNRVFTKKLEGQKPIQLFSPYFRFANTPNGTVAAVISIIFDYEPTTGTVPR